MPSNLELSVVLPAYKEAENLSVLLPRLKSVLRGITENYEIIVVDSMTPFDSTAGLCAGLGVKCVNRRNSDMFGDAVRTGIAEAAGEYVVFMDADGSHAPEFIAKLYGERNNADVVIASRYVAGGDTENSRSLVLMSRLLNMIYAGVLGINCADISNSFKLYPGALLKKLQLRSNNFDIVEEILFKLVRLKKDLKITELPFRFEKRKHGETKRNLVVFIVSFAATLIKLRFGR
jgi:dolichol-phosphate mannosyltransferase